jgi:hypothetical protein
MVAQAHQYLLEKTCTAGGWNFGSPQTLGTDWPPLPSPTAMALIAMQNVRDVKVDKALTYLKELTGPTIDSTIADSLSILARDIHGEDMSQQAPALAERFSSRSGLSENLCAIAAATIASNLSTESNPFKFVTN